MTSYKKLLEDYHGDEKGSTMLALLGNLKRASNYDGSLPISEQLLESGKLSAIAKVIEEIKAQNEKVVLVSHWTHTLSVFETFLKSKQISFERLDGSTPSSSRQVIVDRFNRSENTTCFLLSSKAGGVGLNLVGASRLIMIDIDWNPSIEKQAMARIWRDGQSKPVFIYRFLTTGSIEERIYQRQLVKKNLADSLIDMQNNSVSFTQEELKDLCSFRDDTLCVLHELVRCECGFEKYHFNHPFSEMLKIDPLLHKITQSVDVITFIAKEDSFCT
jgi:DNA repair and recombination protein RAD54B